ncbi:MAG: HD domain-containing phosphohydrolase [Desulfovibrio sp.]
MAKDQQIALIVDHSPTVLHLLHNQVEQHTPYIPQTARSLEDVQRFIEEPSGDIAIAVINLELRDAPQGEAVDFLLAKDIPCIVLTGTSHIHIRNKYIEKNILAFIEKSSPSTMDKVLQEMNQYHDNAYIKVLIVDDSRTARNYTASLLRQCNFQVLTATNGLEALEIFKHNQDIELVITDFDMPSMNGFELISNIRHTHDPDSTVIVGMSTLTTGAMTAHFLNYGANDFLRKPFHRAEFICRINGLMQMKKTQDRLRQYQAHLEKRVKVRTRYLRKAVDELIEQKKKTESAHRESILCLSSAAEMRDKETADHVHRMSEYATIIMEALDMPQDELELVRDAMPLHDVGKIGISDTILLKEGPLTDEEWDVMREHPVIGETILSTGTSELLKVGKVISLSHHEKWDGSGYPHGLAGEDIPLYGRIAAIADVFDALTTARPYKKAFSQEKAINIMTEGRGQHFDPMLLDLFLSNMAKVEGVLKAYSPDLQPQQKSKVPSVG